MSNLIKCPSCAKEVSPEAPTCPNCGSPVKKKTGCLEIIGFCIVGFIGLCVLAAMLGKSDNPASSPGGGQSASPGAPVSAPAPEIVLPVEQQQLAGVVVPYIKQYEAAPNELKKSALRSARRKALADALQTFEFTDWVGTIVTMETTSEGKAHLAIKLQSTPIKVQNWNNELSDLGSNTLIAKGSELFNAVAELAVGNLVRVSGTFRKGAKDHIDEQSVTEEGSMTEPEFTVKFSKIAKY